METQFWCHEKFTSGPWKMVTIIDQKNYFYFSNARKYEVHFRVISASGAPRRFRLARNIGSGRCKRPREREGSASRREWGAEIDH
jgi:hypothetical protein